MTTIYTKIAKMCIMDNGVQFCREIFTKIMCDNRIYHIKKALAKPSPNSACKPFNGTFKTSVKAMET